MAFKPGQSGNPNGRPKGSRNAAALILQELLDGDAKELSQELIKRAKAGDGVALRLCIERIYPPRRDNFVNFRLPKMTTAADAAICMSAIADAVAASELTPSEAADMSKLIENFLKAIELTEIERRLAAIEAAQSAKG